MDPVRPPDATQKDCLLGASIQNHHSTSRSRRSRRSVGERRQALDNATSSSTTTSSSSSHVITWDHNDTAEGDDDEAMLRVAMEESLRELERADAKQQQEKENERAARRQRFGMVVARLRLMRHPTDPVVDEWLERIDEFCNGDFLSPLAPHTEDRLSVWLEKRRHNSPFLEVLLELLKK